MGGREERDIILYSARRHGWLVELRCIVGIVCSIVGGQGNWYAYKENLQ